MGMLPMYLFRCCFMYGEPLTNLSILHLEFFLVSWIAVFTIEKFGRRQLMMFGAAGMSFSMVRPPLPPAPLHLPFQIHHLLFFPPCIHNRQH